jgi:hypothetical protein
MEFMRELPEDESCLQYLWESRYSPEGIHAECPKCEKTREFRRYATGQQRQSWSCRASRSEFTVVVHQRKPGEPCRLIQPARGGVTGIAACGDER